jgi:hypothetical protein
MVSYLKIQGSNNCHILHHRLKTTRPKVIHPKAILPKAILPKAILPKAILPKAILPKVIHPKAVLPKAILPKAILPKVIHPKAILPKVIHPKAILRIILRLKDTTKGMENKDLFNLPGNNPRMVASKVSSAILWLSGRSNQKKKHRNLFRCLLNLSSL